MEYYKTDDLTLDEFDDSTITDKYNNGYVLTRVAKGNMIQTRSVRINLQKFELNSENNRILRKTEGLNTELKTLPYKDYSWEIHKLGKEYYSQKFGDGTMSASKIKAMFNDVENENMTHVFEYRNQGKTIGFCLAYINDSIVHYAYPFYKLESNVPNLGLGMMIRAIVWAKETRREYIYLGSAVDSTARYKLQFEGLEWWENDNQVWSDSIEELKRLLE